jgi:hypothetical protein
MNKSTKMRLAENVARMMQWNEYGILVVKPQRKRPQGRQKRRLVDNIKMDLRGIGWDDKDWIDLAHDRDQWRALLNTVMNSRIQ